MSEENRGASIKGELAVDAATGSVSAKGELTQIDQIARVLRPGTWREQEAFDTINREIRRKQAASEPLSDLEAAVLIAAVEPMLRKAMNLRKVIGFALEASPELADILTPKRLPAASEPEPPEEAEAPEEGEYFFDRFWADCEGVTVERLQRVYGKILGRKLQDPSSFSLRTLNVLRCLDRATAETFEWFLPFRISGILPFTGKDVYGVQVQGGFMDLEEGGLIGSQPVSINAAAKSFTLGEYLLELSTHPGFRDGRMFIPLTQAGVELASIINVTVTPAHVVSVGNFLHKGAPDLTWRKGRNDVRKPWTGSVD